MKLLADDYQGKVRFAYVNIYEDELLKETFGIRTVPNNFDIRDGVVREMGALKTGYKPITEWLEGEYLNE